MHGFLDVETCEAFTAPKRKLTIQQRLESREWIYYIAAEEIVWDYAPNLPDYVERSFRSTYLKQGAVRIGKKYKKAVFTQYTDESFKERAEPKQRKKELGILGPVIRAQIRDIIKIVFKNKASRPYSIYPHGLTIDKAAEGANYPEGGNQSHAVQPGETYTYVWRVIEEDEPLRSDSRCLTRMYHSAVNTPRDIASGLVGPLLICKSQSLSTRNVQLRADKEQHAMFTVFDENKSWYLNENILTYCGEPKNVKLDDMEFYKSNVMHTINGYVYESGQVLGFCSGEIATWHVSSVGEQDDIQTTTFYGHTFELNNREEDFLSLFPMTGETITMNMANVGVWLMASLNTHGTQKGLRVKFKDVECFRDYIVEDTYKYDDYEPETYNVWKPVNETTLQTERSKQKQSTTEEIDPESDDYAVLLGIRSQRDIEENDMEQLDLLILQTYDDELLSTDVIKNITHLGLDFDYNISIAKAAQNETTRDSFIELSLKSAFDISTININTDSTTNPTNISLLQDIDSKRISENSQNTSLGTENRKPSLLTHTLKSPEENETQTQEFPLLSSVEMVNNDNRSTNNVLIYSIPAFTSHTSATDVEDMKDFVLLDDDKQIETKIQEHLVKYIISPTEISNNTVVDNVGTTTEIINLKEPQELNNTKMNPELLYETHQDLDNIIQELNTTQVMYEISVQGDEELNTTQVEYKLSGQQNKELNNSQVEYKFSVQKDKELNKTQLEYKLSLQEDTELNKTQVEYKLLVHKNKELNYTKVEYELSVRKDNELNQTQKDAKSLVHKNKELSGTDTDTEFHVQVDKLLNDSKIIEGNEELNSTHMEFSVQENIRHKGIGITLEDHLYPDLPEPNITKLDSEIFNNTLYDSDTFLGDESAERTNVSMNVTSLQHNETMSSKVIRLWTSSEKLSSDSLPNTSFSDAIFNSSFPESNFFHKNILRPNSSSDQVTPDNETSLDEVVIYLKGSNNTMAILTTPLDTKAKNWSYEGKHETVPVEFPDDINHYITDKQPNSVKEEKTKIHLQRVTPMKGYGMKTKKRKEYKPQVRSDISPRSLSPRGGFAPSPLAPRTTKPNFSEEDIFPKSISGIPRNDFNDYEIYVPHHQQDFDVANIPDSKEEYEYVEYRDPYGKPAQTVTDVLDEVSKYSLQMAGSKSRVYFITAEEVNWDYAGYGQRREDKASVKERPTLFKKVLFRSYLDSSFSTPDTRGEVDEHLGIMGPVIKAEVDETIYVVFRNLASRSYSLHANGVSYSKNMEGLNYDDSSPYWYKYDDEVQPNTTFTYIWTVPEKVGPLNSESSCRIWTYYSGVNPERDIHSGLIGPLLVCKEGTLAKNPVDTQEFMLLFMTFDENKSWYYEQNLEILKKTNRKAMLDPNFNNNIKFPAINGIIYSLKGLRMYASQLVNWHLINMGSPKDFHSIHFHGQTFLNKHSDPRRQGVYPLLPVCDHPLGLISGAVKDSQITASDSRGYWLPNLARLYNTGKYNAWSTTKTDEWIQMFEGNKEAHEVKENIFFPPIISRYVRLYPSQTYNYPTVRMEFYGCELDGCSVPLGMQSGYINDHQITASSVATNWYSGSWHPWLARLDKQGSRNAWQAKSTDHHPWIQIEIKDVKKITGIVTQGAKSLKTEMFVTTYIIEFSDDGITWTKYSDNEDYEVKTFMGNSDNNSHVKNYIYPPIFSRFIRIIPTKWQNAATMRIELLGCDFE
ncbi:Coagulation factor V [Bagarius yarrelli]|uniref:ferroxidase n=1 Tax=Bagarius yarrelli TaxID=175774 RepID=A0A556TXP5_BAGYA|nr:Coagulation factor V [Bagarius yarrelli]